MAGKHSTTTAAAEASEDVDRATEEPSTSKEAEAKHVPAVEPSAKRKAVKRRTPAKRRAKERKRHAEETEEDDTDDDDEDEDDEDGTSSDDSSSSGSSSDSASDGSLSESSSSSESESESDGKKPRRRSAKSGTKSSSHRKQRASKKKRSEKQRLRDGGSRSRRSSRRDVAAKALISKLKKLLADDDADDEEDEEEDVEDRGDDDHEPEERDLDLAAIRAQIQSLALLADVESAGRSSAGQSGSRRRSQKGSSDAKSEGKLRDCRGSSKSGKKEKKMKTASRLEFRRVDEVWDSSTHQYKLTDTVDDSAANEYDEYLFTVKRQFDWKGKYTDTVVNVKSPLLKEALREVLGDVKGVSLVEETPTVDPNMMFLYLEDLRNSMKALKKRSKSERKRKTRKACAGKAAHLKILLRYLDQDYAETKKTLYPLLDSHTITFDLLWALLKPNTIAYTATYGNANEPRAFKVDYATKESSMSRGVWYRIRGRYLDYDGKAFGMGKLDVDISSFKGSTKISNLAAYPLKFHKDPEQLRQQLVERGRKFVALAGMNYRYHQGMAFYKKKRNIVKVNVNGRVMVDAAIFRRLQPNYPLSQVLPDEYSDDDDESDSEDEGSGGCCGHSRRDDNHQHVESQLDEVEDGGAKDGEVKGESEQTPRCDAEAKDAAGKHDGTNKAQQEFTEEQLMLASPVVLGFAFSEKLWLEVTISGLRDIEWNEGAFESLVLPDTHKSIVQALVESHTFHAAQSVDDVIQGKGKGLVAVLHGPPGTGKTLTAEGIAELLRRPLYAVSAGELGTDPRQLEAELNKLLDLSHSWGAVLLLDEADVFLEQRSTHDIHRNALVSIFLRLLEYFQGILFLTTNRVETFDDAFQSRIHVALRYGELSAKAKRAVWKMFVERVQAMGGLGVAEFKESDFEALARNNLNGRQIKNCVRTAQAMAINAGEKLSLVHIKRVLDVVESFDRALKGGTGYVEAMRSYT